MLALHRPTLALLLSAAVLMTGIGCDEDQKVEVVLPPLAIRNTTPGDGVFLNPGAGELFNLSVDFIQIPVAGSVQFQLYPEPLASGLLSAGLSGRNWSWREVEFQPDSGTYSWFIDAVQMPQPVVVRLLTSPQPDPLMGFGGEISTPNPQLVATAGTVVYAVSATSDFNVLDPRTLADVDLLAAEVAQAEAALTTSNYRFGYMALSDSFVVVAIQDTNGDMQYDPTKDWWGYSRVNASTAPDIAIVSSPLAPITAPPYRTNHNILLGPPFTAKTP